MFEEIVGASPALAALLSRVSKVAGSDSTVLITGETGTGKELVARAIHRRSRRAPRAFVAVNCAAIPRDLIASELFGAWGVSGLELESSPRLFAVIVQRLIEHVLAKPAHPAADFDRMRPVRAEMKGGLG